MPLVIKKPSITGRRLRSLGDLVLPYTILHNLEGSQDEVEVVNYKTAPEIHGSWESMPSLSHKTKHILNEEERLTKMLAHITAECSHFDEMGKGIDGSVDSAVVVVPSNGETSQHLNIEFLQKRAVSSSSSSCSTTESLECSSQHTTMTREQQAHVLHDGPAKDEKTSNRHCRWSLPTTVSASRKRLQEASMIGQRLSRPLSCGNLSRTVSASCRRLASSQRLSRPLSHGNNILSRIASETSYKRLREAPNQRVSRPLSHYGYSRASSYYCPME